MAAKSSQGAGLSLLVVASGVFCFIFASPAFSLESSAFVVRYHHGQDAKVTWPERELAEAFTRYWSAMAQRDVDVCLDLEAPHFRFAVDRERYLNYMEIVSKGKLDAVEILEPVPKTPFFVEIPMWVLKTSPSGESLRIGMKDRWVKVKGSWYHVIRDPLVFPGV